MSDAPHDPDRPLPPPAAASPSATARWTPIALVVLAILSFVGYLDLKTQLERIEASAAAPEQAPAPAAGAPEAPPSPTPAAAPPPEEPRPQPDGEWACAGALGREDVAAVIGQHGRSVFECHEMRSREAPDLSGTLHVHLRVDQTGAVDQVRFAGPLEDPDLLGCIRDSLPEWRFPAPTGGSCAIVHAPFSFGR